LTRSFIASRSALLHSFYFIPDSHEIWFCYTKKKWTAEK
jgi:hypothetical protein